MNLNLKRKIPMECTKTGKNKILQEEKNSTLIGREKDTRISDKVTNSQY